MLVKAKQHIRSIAQLLLAALPSKKYTKATGVICLFFLTISFLFPTPTHAIIEATLNALSTGLVWIQLTLAKLFISVAIFLLRFFIQLASYNGYLDAPMVEIGWRLVRDVANMFFVVILLVIAFATILGIERYEWKKTMVKLILSAIFINFSLLLCGLVIDAAHVFTVTFLNALAPVAGGNLINMFNLDTIRSYTPPPNYTGGEGLESDLRAELFIAGATSVIFAFMAMMIIGIYAFMLLIRMVYLWVLLILSPLAFIFMVLPATQAQANEWISDFTKYVLVTPIMVFFLWLAFATMGNAGAAADELNRGDRLTETSQELRRGGGVDQQISGTVAATWHSAASFLIAAAFLLAGAQRVQKLGVAGADTLSSIKKYAGAVATVATGYVAGRWVYDKVSSGVSSGASAIYEYTPVLGARANRARWDTMKEAAKGYVYGAGMAVKGGGIEMKKKAEERDRVLERAEKATQARDQINKLNEEKKQVLEDASIDDDGKKELLVKLDAQIKEHENTLQSTNSYSEDDVTQLSSDLTAKQKEKEEYVKKLEEQQEAILKDESLSAEEKEEKISAAESEKVAYLVEAEKEIQDMTEIHEEAKLFTDKSARDKFKEETEKMHKESEGSTATGLTRLVGWAVRKDLSYQKQLAKTEKQAENRKKLLWKRTGSEAGGNISVFGVPVSMGMGSKNGLWGTGIFKDPIEHLADEAHDRIEEGWLQAEDMRSKAKDYNYQTRGRRDVLQEARVKYDVNTGKLAYQTKKGTVIEEIEKQEMVGGGYEDEITLLKTAAKRRLLEQSQERIGKIGTNSKNPEDKKLMALKSYSENLGAAMTRLAQRIEALKAVQTNQQILNQFNDKHNAEVEARAAEIAKEKGMNMANEGDRRIALAEARGQLSGGEKDEQRKRLQKALKDALADAKKIGVEIDPDEIEKSGKKLGAVLEERISETKKERSALGDKKLKSQQSYARMFTDRIRDLEDSNPFAIPAWKKARLSAQADFDGTFYGGMQKYMLDDAAQRHIWDTRGIETPNTAYDEVSEKLLAGFRDMDYNATMQAVKKLQADILAKRARGEDVTFEDEAIINALAKHMEKGKWIDDGISAFSKVLGSLGKEQAGQMRARFKAYRKRTSGETVSGAGGESGSINASTRNAMKAVLQHLLPDHAKDALESVKEGHSDSATRFDDRLKSARAALTGLDKTVKNAAGLADDSEESLNKFIQRIRSMDRETKQLLFESLDD